MDGAQSIDDDLDPDEPMEETSVSPPTAQAIPTSLRAAQTASTNATCVTASGSIFQFHPPQQQQRRRLAACMIHRLSSFQQKSAFALILAGLLSECATPAPRYNVPIGIGIFMNPTSGFDHRMVVLGLCLAILIDFAWLLRPQELGFNGYFQDKYDNSTHACLGTCALIKVWLVFSTYFDLGPEPPSVQSDQQSLSPPRRPHHPVWHHVRFFFPRKTLPRRSHLSFEVLMRTLGLIWIHGVCGLALLVLGILSAMFYSGKVQFRSMAFGAPLHLMMIFRSTTTLASYFVATQHMNYNGCLKLFGCHKLAEYDHDGGSDIVLKYNKHWLQRVQRAKAIDGLVGVYFLLVFYSAFHSDQFFAGSGLTAVLAITGMIVLVLDFWTPLLIMVVAKCGSMLHTHHKRGTIDVDPYYPNQLEWEGEEDDDDGGDASSSPSSGDDSDGYSSSGRSGSDSSSYSSSWSSGSRSSSSPSPTEEGQEPTAQTTKLQSEVATQERESSVPIVNAGEVLTGRVLERGGGGGGSAQLLTNSTNSSRGSDSARGGGGVWVRHWHEASGRSYLVHSITVGIQWSSWKLRHRSDDLSIANLRTVHFYSPVAVPQDHAAEHFARSPFFLGEFVFDSLSLKLYAKFRCAQQDAIVSFVKKLQLKEIVGSYAPCE